MLCDRNVCRLIDTETGDDFMTAVFADCQQLSRCRLLPVDVGVLSKWLITNAPLTSPNRSARMVLNGVNWSVQSRPIIDSVATALTAAHKTHCVRSNGLLQSVAKRMEKLARQIDDGEATFDQFCWTVLVKLPLSCESATAFTEDDADTVAIYLRIMQRDIAK